MTQCTGYLRLTGLARAQAIHACDNFRQEHTAYDNIKIVAKVNIQIQKSIILLWWYKITFEYRIYSCFLVSVLTEIVLMLLGKIRCYTRENNQYF